MCAHPLFVTLTCRKTTAPSHSLHATWPRAGPLALAPPRPLALAPSRARHRSHLVKKKSLKSKKFQRGVELCKISSEVCEGFLNLVVPKLRTRKDIVVETYVRHEPVQTMDLRLLVRLRTEIQEGKTEDLERAGLKNAPIAAADAPMILPLPMFGAERIDAALKRARAIAANR